ncbi:natterin-3-like [Perca fluviatilis]|nr:natterin-3-like [Perca fluviatilis]XP_039659792.1 natterin-3-like [Perca fluviatilis]
MSLNPSLENIVPNIPANQSENQANKAKTVVVLKGIENNVDQSPSLKVGQTNLEWQTFDGSLPNGAVSSYNEYVKRTDYVGKFRREAGFYNPEKNPCFLYYPYCNKELHGSPFEILVNKDNFEFLEWKDGSWGSVPDNAVETYSGSNVYVGKNQYGLGKVDVQNKCFYLPWEGYEYWYRDYEVLTVNKDAISEDISDVKYKTDDVKIIQHPPETMQKSVLTNNECHSVKQTNTLSKTTQREQRWDTSFSFTVGVKSTITAGIPEIMSASVEVSAETTLQYTKGTTHIESTTHTVSVEAEIPAKHSCRVSMVGYKYTADIPYTARLKRTYRNGKTTWMSISGTYKSVQMGEVRGVVDHSEPIPDAKLCP